MTLTVSEQVDSRVEARKKRNEQLRIERLLASDKSKGYTEIHRDMIVSHAFLTLGAGAKDLLLVFLLKRRFKYRKGKVPICVNENEIYLTWKEFESAPFFWNPSKFSRAKKQLLEHGFIKLNYQGGTCKKDRSVYGVSEKWRMWKDGIDFSPKKQDVKRGFQGRFNHNLNNLKHDKMKAIHTRQNESHKVWL